MQKEPGTSSTIIPPGELFAMFRCDPWELIGYVFISALASSLFCLAAYFLKINFIFPVIAGCIAGCAFMLSSKDRKIKRLERRIEYLQKENR